MHEVHLVEVPWHVKQEASQLTHDPFSRYNPLVHDVQLLTDPEHVKHVDWHWMHTVPIKA